MMKHYSQLTYKHIYGCKPKHDCMQKQKRHMERRPSNYLFAPTRLCVGPMSWEREPNYISSLMNILKKKPTVSKVQELKPNVSSKQLEKPKKKIKNNMSIQSQFPKHKL